MQFRPGKEVKSGGHSGGHAKYGDSKSTKGGMPFRPGGEVKPGGHSGGHVGGPKGRK